MQWWGLHKQMQANTMTPIPMRAF